MNERPINWIAQRHSHTFRTTPPPCYPYMCVYAKRSRRAQALARSSIAEKASEQSYKVGRDVLVSLIRSWVGLERISRGNIAKDVEREYLINTGISLFEEGDVGVR